MSFFPFIILIGCHSTKIWMNRIIRGLCGPQSSFLFPVLCPVVQVHQGPWESRQQHGELPVFEQKLRLIPGTRWRFGLLDLPQPPRSLAPSVLHHHHETVKGLWSRDALALGPAGPAAPEQPRYLLLNPQLCTEEQKRIAWNLVTVTIAYTVCHI